MTGSDTALHTLSWRLRIDAEGRGGGGSEHIRCLHPISQAAADLKFCQSCPVHRKLP
jgi:hypothetical protein